MSFFSNPRCLPWIGSAGFLASLAAQEVTILPETVVTAERRMGGDASLVWWTDEEISRFAPRAIDELLATEPSFSLYRRQSSIFGNPTSAGVSLRRTGVTAAARTLVLRDGIPQNDPFGGWVSWARYRPGLLSSARIVPAAEAAAWGNLSPAGIVQLTSRDPDANRTAIQLTGGSEATWGGSITSDSVSRDGRLAMQGSAFTLHSDGFYAVGSSQRGPLDRRLDLETRGGEARFVWRPSSGVTVEPTISYYQEARGNGTPFARNESEAVDLSLRVTHEGPAQTWQALAYYQHREFEAGFSSVDAARASELPALDQFDVPGEGIGGGITTTLHPDDRVECMLGADLRHLRGETNEDAGFVNGAFLRRRQAGGEQFFGGIFARSTWSVDPRTTLDGSARLDLWTLRDGRRLERHPTTGVLLRDDRFRDRSGLEPSLSVAVRHRVNETLALSASAGTAFRLPSINELYRPFRVRNDLTEANAALDPERFLSVVAGVEWNPGDEFSFDLELFHHWIRDAIANVPLTDPAEAMAVAGSIPPGGTVAQRRNVDAARSWGLEARTRWEPSDLWAVSLTYLYSQTEFVDSPGQPLLEGKAFPQSPTHRLVTGLECDPLETLHLFAQVDFGSSQSDDALDSRSLPAWWSTRLGASVALHPGLSIHARLENLFDEEVTTGLSSDGLRSIGTPRSFWVDMQFAF